MNGRRYENIIKPKLSLLEFASAAKVRYGYVALQRSAGKRNSDQGRLERVS